MTISAKRPPTNYTNFTNIESSFVLFVKFVGDFPLYKLSVNYCKRIAAPSSTARTN